MYTELSELQYWRLKVEAKEDPSFFFPVRTFLLLQKIILSNDSLRIFLYLINVMYR